MILFDDDVSVLIAVSPSVNSSTILSFCNRVPPDAITLLLTDCAFVHKGNAAVKAIHLINLFISSLNNDQLLNVCEINNFSRLKFNNQSSIKITICTSGKKRLVARACLKHFNKNFIPGIKLYINANKICSGFLCRHARNTFSESCMIAASYPG